MAFGEMTQEQRAENLRKAAIKRAEGVAERAANEHKYKLTYLDSNHWAELGSKHKVAPDGRPLRMPPYNEGVSVKGLRKMMRKVGISNDTFKESYTGVEFFVENNPTWTLAATTGLLLELKEEGL